MLNNKQPLAEECPKCGHKGEILTVDPTYGLIWTCSLCQTESPIAWAIDPSSGKKVQNRVPIGRVFAVHSPCLVKS